MLRRSIRLFSTHPSSSSSSSSSSIFTRFRSQIGSSIQSASHRMSGKLMVGSDKAGNKYFQDLKTAKRRWVEYEGDILGDTDTVPMAWHSWLRHGRDTPPSSKELEKEEFDRTSLAAKVAALNAADQKLRLQEIAERHLNEDDTAASIANMQRERDQHGGVGRWGQNGSGVAGGRSQR